MADNIYGVDCGSGKLTVVCNGKVPETGDALAKFRYTSQEFLDFAWFEGSGVLVTESSTFIPRSVQKGSSSSQYFDYEQICSFLKECREKKITVLRFDNNRTYHVLKDFIRLCEAKDKRVEKWHGENLFADVPYQAVNSKGETVNKKHTIKLKLVNKKYKSDFWEAIALGWTYDFCPDSLHELTEKSLYNPDKDLPLHIKLRGEITEESNFVLLQYKAYDKKMNVSCGDFFEIYLHPLLEVVDKQIEQDLGKENGADMIEKYGQRLTRYKGTGEINYNEVFSMYRSIFSVCMNRHGNVQPAGWKLIKKVLGFSNCRRKSGIAGADLHKYLYETMNKAIQPESFDDKRFGTRDPSDPHYELRKTLNRDLEVMSKYLFRVFKKSLQSM